MRVLDQKALLVLSSMEGDPTGSPSIDPATIILIFRLLYEAYKCIRNAPGLASKMANLSIPPAPLFVRTQVKRGMPNSPPSERKRVSDAILRVGDSITADEVSAMCREIGGGGQGVRVVEPW